MKMPDFYITEILGYNSSKDLIENLYLQSLINAYPTVVEIEGIAELNENNIRDKFQKVICFESGKLSELLNKQLVFLAVENQIINKKSERKRTDIEFSIPGLKFVIECKKLKETSKKQYIEDGISRFINHKYIGPNEKYAGMCSFVVRGDINNIIKGTKQRVEDYHWLKTNLETVCNFENSFSTNHKKIDNQIIVIYHFFFDMLGKQCK